MFTRYQVAWGDFQVRERKLGDGEICQLTDIETTPSLTGAEGRGEFCRFILFKVKLAQSSLTLHKGQVLPGGITQ